MLFASANGFPSSADPLTQKDCLVRVLEPVQDDVGNQWEPGKTLPMIIERDDQKGVSFCAHGGSCIPQKAGGKVAVVLLNCHIGKSIGGGDHLLIPAPQGTKKP